MFKWFCALKLLLENQIGKKIKISRTDNGTKYEFNDYCIEANIKRETTVAYNPEKNGVSEKKNQTIMEATCAMLHDLGLLKFLRGKALNFKTPEEVFISKKLDVFHFRIFGCPMYFMCLKRRETSWEHL